MGLVLTWTSNLKRNLWSSKASLSLCISSYLSFVYSHRVAEFSDAYSAWKLLLDCRFQECSRRVWKIRNPGLASVTSLGLPFAKGTSSSPGRSKWFECSNRVFLWVCRAEWPDINPLLCCCWEEQFPPKRREKEEKAEMVAMRKEASFLLLAFTAVIAFSVSERKWRYFLGHF